MITFDEVTRRFGERLALDSVSWHMDEGECLVLLGPSGAGKTTVLRLITHEIKPTSGTVLVGTFRSGRLSRSQRALLRRTLGVIYEDFRADNDATVRRILRFLGGRVHELWTGVNSRAQPQVS